MIIYVASPYSHESPFVREDRFRAVEQFTAKLIKTGVKAFSPIAAFHHMVRQFALPTDAKYWSEFNYHFLKNSDRLYILQLEGWDTSKGVQMEIEWARELYIPIFYHPSSFMKEYDAPGAARISL